MAVTRCPRCGNKITPNQRFCQECGLSFREADRVSDNLTNNPVPFRLSDKHRKIYAAFMANETSGDSGKGTSDDRTEKPSGGAKKSFALLGIIAALALLAAGIFVWQIWKNKKDPEPPVQQPESTKTIENTEARSHFEAETVRQTEETVTEIEQTVTEIEEIVTETEIKETEQKITETEQAITETEETERTIIETGKIDQTELPVTEKREEPEKITEPTFLVIVENGTGGGYYHSGEKVSITAEVPEDSGLEFSGWEVTEGDVILSESLMETAYFTMPKENVSVKAGLSEIKYTVTVTNGEGEGDYSAGDKVTLTAGEPEENHIFDKWEIISGDVFLSDPTSETTSFYMPRQDVEISAKYREKTYTLTVKNGTADAMELHAGETTTITADKADDGYTYIGWVIEGDASVKDSQKEQTTLTIGSGDVTVSAKYETIPVLKSGEELRDAFLKLAGSESEVDYVNPHKKIERFCRSDTVPPDGTKTIDISETGQAVQAWYDNAGGTIYWYADVETVRLNENTRGLFKKFTSLKEADFNGIDTGNVTDMSWMFFNCSSLTSLNLSNFDTGNVTDMKQMFCECSSLTSLDLSNFDTGNVTDMHYMFNGCSNLTSLDLSSFDTGNVTDMSGMFGDCSSLTSLGLSSFDTGKVTDMHFMFNGCGNLTSLDLSSFDTGNVTDMSGMFGDCDSLTSLELSSFDTGNVTDMRRMFSGCSSLRSLDLSSFDTGNVTDMGWMFSGCSSLTSLELSSFDTGNVTDMEAMFSGCRRLIKPKTTDAKIINEYENKW